MDIANPRTSQSPDLEDQEPNRCGGLVRKGCGVWFVPASETSVFDGRFSNVTGYSRLMTREYIERSQADGWDSAPTRTHQGDRGDG